MVDIHGGVPGICLREAEGATGSTIHTGKWQCVCLVLVRMWDQQKSLAAATCVIVDTICVRMCLSVLCVFVSEGGGGNEYRFEEVEVWLVT